jgi:tRNA dimethylallyltransferase
MHTSPTSLDYEKYKREGVERMKVSTRQYAKQQITWLKNKMCRGMRVEHEHQTGAIYILNATDLTKWDRIASNAVLLATSFLNNESNSDTLTDTGLGHLLDAPVHQLNEWTKHTCDVCTVDGEEKRVFNGEYEWNIHLASGRHKRTVKWLKQRSENPYLAGKALRKKNGTFVKEYVTNSTQIERQ